MKVTLIIIGSIFLLLGTSALVNKFRQEANREEAQASANRSQMILMEQQIAQEAKEERDARSKLESARTDRLKRWLEDEARVAGIADDAVRGRKSIVLKRDREIIDGATKIEDLERLDKLRLEDLIKYQGN